MSSPAQRRFEGYRFRWRSLLALADGIRESLHLVPEQNRRRMEKLAGRLRFCALAQYVRVSTPDNDATVIEVSNKRACKIRLCPQCLYRAACRDRATLFAMCDYIWDRHPDARAILLTLTTRNRPLSELREALRDHAKALPRFFKSKLIVQNSLGAFTAIEFALRGKQGAPETGVHSHSIIIVPGTYFANDVPAIWQAEFRDLWRRSARLDYDPIIDCRVARSSDGDDGPDAIYGAIVECAKYCISLDGFFDHSDPARIRCDGLIAATVLRAFHRQRLHRFDRCFADARKRAPRHTIRRNPSVFTLAT